MTVPVNPAASAARAVPLVERAYSVLDVKRITETDDLRIIEGMATTPTTDRLGDVVEPLGVTFKNPLPLLHQHNSGQPVGFVTLGKPTKDGVPYVAKFAKVSEPASLKERIDVAWAEVKAKLVRGVSIGFRALETAVMKDGGFRFVKVEVLELSLVTIPANKDASISVIKSIDSALLAASGNESAVRSTLPASRHPSNHVVKPQEGKRTMSKRTVAEALAAYEATKQAKANEMNAIMEKSMEDDTTLSGEEKEKYDALEIEIKEIDDHLSRLKRHAEVNSSLATEAKGADPATASASRSPDRVPAQPVRARQPVEKGTAFIRYVQCLANAKGNIMQAERMAMAQDRWVQETPEVIDAIKAAVSLGTGWVSDLTTRSAVAPGTTTNATWAGALVNYEIMASEFIEYLRPLTVIGRIPGLRRVPFKVKIPRQTGGATVNWVGEASVKPLSSLTFDTVTLEFSKIAGIIPLSEELVRFSNPSAEAIVRQDLGDSIVQFMDSQFTDPTVAAVTNVSPASITNGVTPVTASGTSAAALRADLKNVLDNFLANLMPLAGIVAIMTQSQALAISLMQTSLGTAAFPGLSATGGSLAGIPVITSENLAATGGSPTDGYPIIFMRARDILLADDGQVSIDTSREASLQMDSAPTSPATADTVMVSLWQNNLVAVKAERFINWGKARTNSVEFIQNAKYAE